MFTMRPKLFLLSIFVTLFFFVVGYLLLYFYQVEKSAANVISYKNFLLENTQGMERIIVESGSNSHHGIDSNMLEKHFGKVAINIADTGSFPLKNKLYRIGKNAQSGDVVLMPLEYLHYSYGEIPKNYFDSIFSKIPFYFTSLPLKEQLFFVWHTPFSSLFQSLFYTQNVQDRSFSFLHKFNEGERGEHIFVKKRPLDYWSAKSSCADYLFYMNKKTGFTLNDTFKENVALMQKIEEEKKINFIITYPSVAGDACYSGQYSAQFSQMMQEVQNTLEKHQIGFIGAYNDASFGEESIDNTYYHILPAAKKLRTKKLIERIDASADRKLFYAKKEYKLANIAIEPLLQEKLQPLEALHTYSSKDTAALALLEGWYKHEGWGVWSQGERSTVAFRLDPSLRGKDLTLELDTLLFGAKDKTQVFLNSKELGFYLLDGKTKLSLGKEQLESEIIKLEFRHTNLISPKDANVSKDTRQIKLAFKSLRLLQ